MIKIKIKGDLFIPFKYFSLKYNKNFEMIKSFNYLENSLK